MSGPESKPKIEQMSHEEIEEAVMTALPKLDSSQLERLCELIGLDVPAESKGKKRALAKALRQHLDAVDEDNDDDWQKFVTIHNHLTTKDGKKKSGTLPAVVDGSSSSATSPGGDADVNSAKDSQSRAGDVSVGSNSLLRLRDYKFPGTIGGDPALSYTSIQYQVDSARALRYTDKEIRAGVVKAISPSHEPIRKERGRRFTSRIRVAQRVRGRHCGGICARRE